jgi:uncharacterized protein (TIGR02246 family)
LNIDFRKDGQKLYEALIQAWNTRNAHAMADLFAEDGELIGFDGSLISGGPKAVFEHLDPIFKSYPTPPFTYKIKACREVGTAILLRSIVGMVPPGKTALEPSLNAHQTLLAKKVEGTWKIALFQNTPAQFHGRPDLRDEMTEELRQVESGTAQV